MTGVGEVRAAYAAAFAETDPRPSRFTDEGEAYRAWAERADAWAADELTAIADTFPMRDRRGHVTGFYIYRRGINSGREAGPFPTIEGAEAARSESNSLDVLDIVCGHVFTSRGTIVREGVAS